MTDISNHDKVFYRYEVITDPDDPNISQSLDQLLTIIESDNNFKLIESNLSNGLVRYNISYYYNKDDTPDIIQQVDSLAGLVNYTPISISLNMSEYNNNNNNTGALITGASETIKILTEKLLSATINNIETVRRNNNVIVFNPITEDEIALYENPLYLMDYYSTVNMEYLKGYQVLSSDPVVRYVLKRLYEQGEYVPEDLKTISVSDILLLPVGNTNEEQDYYRKIKDRVGALVTKYREDGYFSIELGIHNISDILFIKELGKMWNTEVVYDEDMEHIVLKHNNVDFGSSPESWFQHNINTIKRGDFPRITLYGPWQQFNVGGDYNQVYGKPWNHAIIHYGALLAYHKLGLDEPLVQPYTHDIKVNNDLSVTVSLPTYNLVILFKDYFSEIINGYYNMDTEHYWYAQPCKDLTDGVIKRWYVQSIDKRAMPMVIKQVYPDGSNQEILLYRSPAVSLYYKNNPLDFKNVNMDTLRSKFIEQLRNYYKICHTGAEPVLLENIDEMELSDLLELVEVEEGKTGPTYCYSRNTILNLDPPVSPMTRKPLSDNVMIRAMFNEWGLRGLFRVGPLMGLYDELPKKILVQPKSGSPIINKEDIEPIRHSITGDIYNIYIGFEDGQITDLFDIANIATDDYSDLKQLVNDLWYAGFFLSYWTSVVQKYTDNIDSFPVIVTNKLLLYGADSKADGTRAMDYLKVSANLI